MEAELWCALVFSEAIVHGSIMTGVVLDNIKSYGQLDNKTKQLQQKENTSCQQCLTG